MTSLKLDDFNSVSDFFEAVKTQKRGYSLKDMWSALIYIGSWLAILAIILLSFMLGEAKAEQIGTASYYTYKSCIKEGTSGVWTASGERFNEDDLTCAMRSRDFGKYYKVTNLANGKSVIVRHNDFGPNKKLHKQGRIVDLSKGAFQSIADLRQGIIKISVEAI